MNKEINYNYLNESGVSKKKHIPIWLEFGCGYHRDGGFSINTICGCHIMTCFKPNSNERRNIYIVENKKRANEVYDNAVCGYRMAERKENSPISNVIVEDYERYGLNVHTITYKYR